MIAELLPLFQGIIERGLIFSLPVVAVHLSSRVISFDDLTMEGSFGIGSAVTAVCLQHHLPWSSVVLLATLSGGLCGSITGILHTKFGINKLISGIITATGAFSITIALAGSFLSVSEAATIFDLVPISLVPMKGLVILLLVVLPLIMMISWFLKTQIGFILRAFGNNPQMLTLIGKDKDLFTIGGLFLSNALTACAGSLFVQYTGYFSLWMQVGILILALAGLMLSEIFSTTFGMHIIVGSILYQALVALTFELQLDPSWNKLITALLMIGLFTLQRVTTVRKATC